MTDNYLLMHPYTKIFSVPNDDDLEIRESRFMPFATVYEVDEDATFDLSKLDIMGNE
jgi:hypothetical protein